MFQSLRVQLLWQYYAIMAAILVFLSAITYWGVGKILYHELDQRLDSLADLMINNNQWLNTQKPLLNRSSSPFSTEIGIEWFSEEGHLIAHQGLTNMLTFPPEPGILMVKAPKNAQGHSPQIRTLTVQVFIDRSEFDQPPLEGYLRLSRSTQNIEQIKSQILYFSFLTIILALGLVGVAGLWLTQQAIKPVEQNVQKLKQFTADASHEFKTPLSSIKSCIEVIYNHPERIHPKDARKLEVMAKATERMIHLTQDLLFLARSDGTKAQDESYRSTLYLRAILDDLVELLEPLAQEKAITLYTSLEAEGIIKGNSEQINRLFTNLIENAIKYTPNEGRIYVSLRKDHRYIVVEVRDTGIGIAKEHLSKVFDRLWRADEARQQGGNGLGLSIAMAIAQSHGGNITVKSDPGKGTRFKVSLPLR